MTLLSEFSQNGRLFYFWKGRIALYVLLRALDIGAGDEVILPGFSCVVVPNAIIYTGAKPVYADIDPDTYNITVDTIAPLITSRTRVIITQNTFGLSPDLDPIMALAERHNLFVIEDCAHGLGGSYKGRPAGSVAHASFFSTQWSKPISTGLGGIAFVRDADLAERVADFMLRAESPSYAEQLVLAAQELVRPLADRPLLYYPLVDIYRFLTQKLGLSVGSSVGDELQTTEMPSGFLKRMGPRQQREWQRGVAQLAQIVERRQTTARYYDDYFSHTHIKPPYRPPYAGHSMLRYTIRVPDKASLLAYARRRRIPLGDWFSSPLHPVQGNLDVWGYRAGQCPEAEKACAEVVNLFTDKPLRFDQLNTLFEKAR